MDDSTVKKIKESLGTKTLEPTGRKASGCINEGEAYKTDQGLIFVKKSSSPNAKIMFEAEFASLSAIKKTATIRVPHPIKVIEGSDGTFYCILEYLDLRSSRRYYAELGEKLADLHLHNENVAKHGSSELPYTKQFGFFQTTCVGALPVENTWHDDWPTFYTKRLEVPINHILNEKGSTELSSLWKQLRPLIPKFFENVEVEPSLIHGDLWGGNCGETDTEPVIFDPGCVYAHHEFEVALTTLFGGFTRAFYDAYHRRIPKAPGFKIREQLYQLFHVLNHWHHFAGGYKDQSLSMMKRLIKTKFPIS